MPIWVRPVALDCVGLVMNVRAHFSQRARPSSRQRSAESSTLSAMRQQIQSTENPFAQAAKARMTPPPPPPHHHHPTPPPHPKPLLSASTSTSHLFCQLLQLVLKRPVRRKRGPAGRWLGADEIHERASAHPGCERRQLLRRVRQACEARVAP